MSADMSPKEFELLVHEYLIKLGKDLKVFKANHDSLVKGQDGEYQIDILVEFEVLKANFVVIVECKRHKSPIKREIVLALNSKLDSLGANKGMLFATADFQRGAITYAQLHNITLIKVTKNVELISPSRDSNRDINFNDFKVVHRFNIDRSHGASEKYTFIIEPVSLLDGTELSEYLFSDND